ncbi:MAG TPA: metallophosphoesterase [Candidatus Thermoplasmatota archaeon]|nr:metallophosphoesterase [Candidatus Thermoplasmatota archaeon]
MRAEPRFGERALLLESGGERVVVVGDLHVGLESDLKRSGLHIPSQTGRMRSRLGAIVRETMPDRLVVLGDLKHAIAYAARQETEELEDFFLGLGVPVDLVPGNHDADIPVLAGVEVHPATGIRVGEAALLHGHTWPSDRVMDGARLVAFCHNHPAVLLVDELGHRHKEPCWIRAPFAEAARERWPTLDPDARAIAIPAFNDLVGGVAFNALEGEHPLGPLLANGLVDLDAGRLYTLDGVDLGTLADMREFGAARETERKPRARRRARRKPRDGSGATGR